MALICKVPRFPLFLIPTGRCLCNSVMKGMQERHQDDVSLLVLAVVKDKRSWGKDRGFLDFLNLLVNMTQQTPDLTLSLGILASDTATYRELG